MNLMQKCKVCSKSNVQRHDSGMINRVCLPQQRNVNGFETCKQYEERQCTLCKYEKLDPSDDRCELCMKLIDKPYFEIRMVQE